ncbi:efflux RND transporter permease subunit [Bradyrhizobium sp. U87765 SZCCT0131]|uniref:efflux RND transporter permease subunit n=1 Tax=unclassified Bradyrhizobium TaxID=2631580 RepID=UPI001BAD55E9|nr:MULTISPECIES: efflux RND transporter permease subunit [unclassified Bradyrhizobium]MBR1219278.1 efflux RND transporter permease subunit [Bradyrhizobium sp. U87765 SZCCT0131]MBR1261929.1 efflux RND transporter permease subunit [Bradyrhizobium sp. U87765 SZCCT0134]MBR1306218.1 efflux RND transporter permease subunit [Bradyrhizobium sp. U87765 SZCCT0110]MBR1317711.1 efflux RND transporter permease subunit [Bradyrhizobium sp. U87765 SZCCT0109]MBR1351413.1 efflux RND transporter permease subunit
MAFTDLFIRRPILSTVVSLLILLVGGSALVLLPVRQYPNLESATIVIDTAFPGATQEVMQGFVTTPIAQSIATANGIAYLTSSSTQGKSQIKAKLVLNANADRAMTEVLAKVQQVKYRLPAGVFDPVISKITDGASAVQYIAFTSDTLSIPQITDYATRVAQPLFTSIPGVASADLFGAQALAMRVWIDPVKLAARGMTAGDIAAALRANNVQAAPGQLKGERTVTNITATTDVTDIEGFRRMVVKTGTEGLVRLSDIATVEIGGQNYDMSARDNGRPTVYIGLQPTPDGNPLEIVKASNALIKTIQASAPPGLEVTPGFDITHFVNASIAEVQHTLIEAIAIVIVVILLFLGSFRAVVIPVVTIPLSLVGSAALMLAFGFSINLLTLLAMVLAIGLVVDDAIVVVENIHRHIEEGLSPLQAALVGAREIVGPVIAMTITLAAVYAPIGMMGGLTGSLFREFAFTLAGSVIVSGVVALTLSPMMSSRLLSADITSGRFARAVEHRFTVWSQAYGRALAATLELRPLVLTVAVVVMGAIVVLFLGSKRELAPQEDQGFVFTAARAPQYANIDYTSSYTADIIRIYKSLPEYENSFFINGTDGQNNAFGGVMLTDWTRRTRSATDIQNQLYGAAGGVLGTSVTPFQPAALPASTGGLPFQMVLRSPADFSVIYSDLEALKRAAWQSGLFVFVDSDLAFDSPAAQIRIDQAKAGEVGLTMQAIADTLAVLVGENYVNRFNFFERSYDVIPQVRRQDRLTPDSLGRFQVRARSGEMIPLSTVVKVDVRPQANRLPQFNQMNSATLSAVLKPGVTMGQAVAFMKAQQLSPGITIDWLSDSRQFVEEGNRLTVSFGLALIVIFLVLAAQFESFRDPLVILVTVPLAVCGALLPLYLGFTTLNIYTQIGLVTLIGLISKHGILMVSFANEIQHHEGLDRAAAIRKAAMVRMRPVLMTTAAMVAGLVPLLFADGAGAASRFAIGIVVVMGMLIGTLFTLFVLPTFYVLLARDHRTHERDHTGVPSANVVRIPQHAS